MPNQCMQLSRKFNMRQLSKRKFPHRYEALKPTSYKVPSIYLHPETAQPISLRVHFYVTFIDRQNPDKSVNLGEKSGILKTVYVSHGKGLCVERPSLSKWSLLCIGQFLSSFRHLRIAVQKEITSMGPEARMDGAGETQYP